VYAWQSAGRTQDEWLGPDILEVLRQLARAGAREVVICPAGFVSEHLEILYDIDIECQQLADELGIRLVRTAALNDDPAFIRVLADLVYRRGSESGRAEK
ncbi:MAG: ferrochelatase, partial [Alicyclobacillus shizuokensis]|nr:ferrochelatase [Alicyclobacillus shizuokensis]